MKLHLLDQNTYYIVAYTNVSVCPMRITVYDKSIFSSFKTKKITIYKSKHFYSFIILEFLFEII